MDVYVSFTDKEKIKIEEWKNGLPKSKEKRTFGISFLPSLEGERDADGHLLLKAVFKSNDGHKLVVAQKAALHN
jgi:hypothetical protein